MGFFSGNTGRLFLVNVMTAVSYAFILPVMSLFLINGLHASPIFITFYSLGFALSGLFFSQLMGGLADKGYPAKRLFIFSVLALFLAGIAFTFCRHPVEALIVGIFLMGPGNASIPLLLSMIRKHSMTAGLNSTRLNTQMRSGVSIVWIAGPALAFVFADKFGFTFNFLASAALSGMTILVSQLLLAKDKKTIGKGSTKKESAGNVPIAGGIWVLGAVMMLANLSNNTYLTIMPLYLVKELNLPASFPGFLLGATAIMEIPVMLAAAHLAEKTGKEPLIMVAFIFAAIYYSLLQLASNMTELIVLQLLNGLFFGIFVGLGISLIQDALPERSGFASAFHSNAMRTGMMAGNGIAGVMAQLAGFRITLLVPLLSVCCAALLMFCINRSHALKKHSVNG
ncbi:MFS transporter [Escherichia sp. ESNIH1]|uniref:sugar efflux transporter n=1 Tax=Enterobacteriaceae TaxID=543 RepID=UPI000CDDBEB9|nr:MULTISPECIES: sugar efflux transporter [Enterobacteriaceae]POU01991.1 MFS transporter [Escherichia sp. ESNIH1]